LGIARQLRSSAPLQSRLSKTKWLASALANYQIIRRNGAVVPFEPNKIAVALMKAFLAVHGTQGAASASVREVVED
jgi:ribonucleoside-diphosphate reductase alpha chain